MSGGDGRGHNSGAHNTGGNINGGPTGLGGNGGASDGSGWSSENNPWGGGSGNQHVLQVYFTHHFLVSLL